MDQTRTCNICDVRPERIPALTSEEVSLKYHFMKTELVTTLKRRATKIIAGLQDGAPILITQHGKPAAYLVDVHSYDELNRRLSVMEGIALGEQALREGRVYSQAEAKRRFARWLK
jgi:prevent-host-death family protein